MAYTKYSLTPSSNTAAPPDGAPEGMLPSAVNDTMRDMMSQIRDCGDGIRGGTYTMTAPVITGGSISGTTFASSAATITGGTINGTTIGATTASTGAFSTLSATGVTTVQAGTVSLPAITTTGDTNTGIYFPAADTIAFTEGGSESMRIDSSGNVGIGTSSPSTKLTVSSATNAGINVTDGTVNTIMYSSTGGVASFGTTTNHPLQIYTNNSAKVTLDTSGNLLVGTTTSQGKVTVTQDANLPTAHINNLNASFSDTSIIVYTSRTTTNSSFNQLACYNGNFSGQFLIRDSGNAVNTNNSYGAVSDIKLKENIVDATPKLEDLCKIKIRQYTLKNDENKIKQIGVVAQELEEVFAGLVEETFDKDINNNDLGTTTKSVKYSVFVPMLIKAIQEQQAMINELKAKVAALEAA